MSLKALQRNHSILSQSHSYTRSHLQSPNLSCIQNIHRISKRKFGGDDTVRYPKVFKNVFNKKVSRDGKRVYYTVFPYDYNEPWPFPPVYDKETGQDLNRDPVWGIDGGEAPPSSITGKPRRALGHYPWLGRPIVPLDDNKRYIQDDQVAPYPYFCQGRFEANRTFYFQWAAFIAVYLGLWYFVDIIWRGDGAWGNLANQRDELFFKQQMAPNIVAYAPLGTCYYGNPTRPWKRSFQDGQEWVTSNDWISARFTSVFVPPSKEDHFADEDVNYFKLPGYNC